MKTKKVTKKLVLNKETVNNLTNPQMQMLKGGLPDTSKGIGNPCQTHCDTGFCCERTNNEYC
jgi:hypothetical protein